MSSGTDNDPPQEPGMYSDEFLEFLGIGKTFFEVED